MWCWIERVCEARHTQDKQITTDMWYVTVCNSQFCNSHTNTNSKFKIRKQNRKKIEKQKNKNK